MIKVMYHSVVALVGFSLVLTVIGAYGSFFGRCLVLHFVVFMLTHKGCKFCNGIIIDLLFSFTIFIKRCLFLLLLRGGGKLLNKQIFTSSILAIPLF